MDVDERSARHLLPARGVVVGGPRRLDDECADETVLPAADAVDMVVEVRRTNLRVGVPAVADELGADDRADGMCPVEGTVEHDRVGTLDRGDTTDLERAGLLQSHADERPDAEPAGVPDQDTQRAPLDGDRRPLPLDRERAHRLFEIEPGVHSVARLDVELHEVNVRADLAERVIEVVGDGVGQGDIDAVFPGVGADCQRTTQRRIAPDGCFVLGKHELGALGVDEMEPIVDRHGKLGGAHREPAHRRAGRAQRLWSVGAWRRGHAIGARPVEVGGRAVPWSERWSRCEVWPQHRIGRPTGGRLEQHRRSLTGRHRLVSRPDGVGLRLADDPASLLGPVEHRGVVALADARRRQRGDGPGVPRWRKCIGRDRRNSRADPIGQLRQRRQCVGRDAAILQRVVHPPDAPHASEVVVGDVAVNEIVAGALLAPTGGTLMLDIERLRRPDGLRIRSLRGTGQK